MDASSSVKKDAAVTRAAFDRLLLELDPDRERAGERYEQIRQKLSKFFQWRGCEAPEDLVDLTMDRVAKKVGEGADIHTRDVYLFFHGFAVNVLREHWKNKQKAEVKSLDELPVPPEAAENLNDAAEREQQLECLDGCVHKLPPQQLKLVTEYHQGEGGVKIARRNELAKQLNIPLNALRIRVYRIRGELESCVSACLAAAVK